MEVEEEEEDADTREAQKEDRKETKGKEKIATEKEGEQVDREQDQTQDQIQMEIDPQQKQGEEEKIMRKLIQEWKHLDERFIPEDQKQLYKDMFQRYKEKRGRGTAKQPEHLGSQGDQNMDTGLTGKSGRKRGRRPMSETIQMVGDTLVNLGKVIPLSEVFQQPQKLLK